MAKNLYRALTLILIVLVCIEALPRSQDPFQGPALGLLIFLLYDKLDQLIDKK